MNQNNKTYTISLIVCCLISLFFLQACDNDKSKRLLSENELEPYKKTLEDMNKALTRKDKESIENYAKRRNWKMNVTDRGLYYMIYQQGDGAKVVENKIVTINFEISLLSGQVCYSSDSLGPKSFLIGKGIVESGLEEGVLFMHEGDKARLIMPPYLAYGLVGDDDRIPMRSILIYDIEVLSVEDSYY